MMRNWKTYLLAIVVFSTAAIGLASCNNNTGTTQAPAEPVAEGREAQASATPQETIGEEANETKTQNQTEKSLAIEPYEIEGVVVSLLNVKRSSGNTLNIYWKMTNTSSEDKTLVKCSAAWYCAYKLAAGTYANGTYIIDSINQKKHLVVRANKKPVVSTFKTPIILSPNSSINVWAKFPAPPADVKTVSIYLPGVAPIEDIRITE